MTFTCGHFTGNAQDLSTIRKCCKVIDLKLLPYLSGNNFYFFAPIFCYHNNIIIMSAHRERGSSVSESHPTTSTSTSLGPATEQDEITLTTQYKTKELQCVSNGTTAVLCWAIDVVTTSEIVLCMPPANERRRYIVKSSLIGWAHTHKYCLLTSKP